MTVAIQALEGVRERLRKMAESLRPVTTLSDNELKRATNDAADALENFRTNPNDRDFVWKNGDVPIALQRWESLGVAHNFRESRLPACRFLLLARTDFIEMKVAGILKGA